MSEDYKYILIDERSTMMDRLKSEESEAKIKLQEIEQRFKLFLKFEGNLARSIKRLTDAKELFPFSIEEKQEEYNVAVSDMKKYLAENN